MKVHVLKQEQRLPVSREEAWAFFSTPRNLDDITPPDAGFEVTYISGGKMDQTGMSDSREGLDQTGMSDLREGSRRTGMSDTQAYDGQLITYKVKVVPLVTMTWVTEIKCVDDGKSFIDVQLFGPYRLWHHRHTFEEIEGGVLMTDLVHYVMPMGFIGEIARWLFVGKKLERVFAFRRKVLQEKFGRL